MFGKKKILIIFSFVQQELWQFWWKCWWCPNKFQLNYWWDRIFACCTGSGFQPCGKTNRNECKWSWTILILDSYVLICFSAKWPAWGWELGTQITPQGWIFWTMIFIILKNSHQDLSNEGSNFILISLEVGHWVAQTQPFLTNYMNLQILASQNLRIV